ncbi:hypothetical protein FisN_24Hu226 [Fistulifera solaris]|uniref:Uncharacterized protein n=1 Tax=Fistulifera solaris TaxID=1519565 RepID=A0A1Z5K374_FISSO|nr:hypothetical protein FisN_24Hu226 [Fistulifera solaris]|eukprot:GAX20521.1 hypothetical protein FisN_24Hu226 [Fistulifera solaris]
MKDNKINPIVWHEELPLLVSLANKVLEKKEYIRKSTGSQWKSKQWVPASGFSVEETVNIAISFGDKSKALQHTEHSVVRRGELTTLDAILDDSFRILRKELSDMAAFQTKSTASVSVVTGSAAAASLDPVAAVAAVTGGETAVSAVSRKRPYSRSKKNDDGSKKNRKGPKKARVATNVAQQPVASRLPANNCGPSLTPIDQLLPVTASSKGLEKWQIDKLMDWMKENDYNCSPDWAAIDGLVESNGMKPSQIVAWIAELGASVVKLRSGGVAGEDSIGVAVEVATEEKQPEIITIEDDDDDDEDEDVSVPELAEENDKDDDISSLLGLSADEMIDDFYAKYAGVSLPDATEDVDVDVAGDDNDEATGTWDPLIAEFFVMMNADELDVAHDEKSEPSVAKPCKVQQDACDAHSKARNAFESEGEAALESSCLESLESLEELVLELGFNFDDDCECGTSSSSACVQEGTKDPCIDGKSSNLLLGPLTSDEDALIKELALSLSGVDEDLYSPSTRIRSDSTDSIFGCLLP